MICLETFVKISLQDVLKTPWRCLEDVFQGILKTFWRRLQNVLKMSWRRFWKTSWRRLEASWKRLEGVLKTYGQDEYIGVDQDVLKTCWRRFEGVFWRRKAKASIFVLKTSWRRLLKTKTKEVFKTSSSRQMFAGYIPVFCVICWKLFLLQILRKSNLAVILYWIFYQKLNSLQFLCWCLTDVCFLLQLLWKWNTVI